MNGISLRRCGRGLLVLAVGLAFLGTGAVSLAEPADQAATPTPTPTAGGTATAVPCVSTSTGIRVLVENPSPGDLLVPGNNVVLSGVAYDPAASSGTGIDRVSAYLGDRDAGGVFLGNATLGLPSPVAGSNSQFATAGFTLRSLTLPTGTGARTLFVYAHSSVSNKDGIASVPVFLGAVPTPVKGQVPTAVLPAPPSCTPTPVPTVPSTPTATAVPPTPTLFVVPAPVATPTPIAGLPSVSAPPTTAALAVATPLRPPAATATAARANVAAAPTTATVAPRGGGIPAELGFGVLALGALVLGGGVTLRRRERRAPSTEGNTPPAV